MSEIMVSSNKAIISRITVISGFVILRFCCKSFHLVADDAPSGGSGVNSVMTTDRQIL